MISDVIWGRRRRRRRRLCVLPGAQLATPGARKVSKYRIVFGHINVLYLEYNTNV